MSEEFDWVTLSGRKAKGLSPEYFDDPALDRLYSLTLALAGEVSVLRERQDTVERLLEAKGTISRADIETFAPEGEVARERSMETRAYIARIMRGFQQQMEAMKSPDPPVTEWVEKFSQK
ncbi:MAG: hypothetical protein ACK5NN_09620 [Sphingomonadaceae bacterium]